MIHARIPHPPPRRRRWLRRLAAIVSIAAASVAAAAAVAGCGGGSAATAAPAATAGRAVAATRGACGADVGRPTPLRHVVWIVMENQAYSGVIGSRSAPYLTALAASCGLATRFTAEAHPSLPNYIAMTSGSTLGVKNDAPPSAQPLGAPSIFTQLGTGWRALEESMPRACDLSDSGQYAVRHNPAVYYTRARARCAAQDVPLSGAPRPSAGFTFVTPNLCHDMHSCAVRDGDRWLAGFIPRLLRTPEYRSGSTVVFITWDEDDGSAHQHIPTLVVSRRTRPGTRSATPFNHYALLGTTESILGLPRLGAAAHAPSMRSAFGLG
jgi:hypothetical protein